MLEISNEMSLHRQVRIKEAEWAERTAIAKEQEVTLHAKQWSLQQEQESAISRAIDLLQTEYGNRYNVSQMIKAIKILENKEKASIFLQLQGEIRDVWLDTSIEQ